MKKKECPSCAMEVDRSEKECPFCHYEFPTGQGRLSWIAILLLVIMLFYFIL